MDNERETDALLTAGREILRAEAAAIAAVAGQLDRRLADAIRLIYDRTRDGTEGAGGGTVVLSGIGKSGLVGQRISASFASTGTPSHFLHPVEALHGDLGYPCIVKPASSGSSYGLTLVRSAADLRAAVEKAQAFGGRALVERYVPGKEITVAVLDGEVLGSCEIVPPGELYGTDGKYQGGSKYFTPARLSPTRRANVEALALAAHQALGCRGLSRIDVIATEMENDFILEVNTLPGMTATSLAPKIAAHHGWSFGELCERILDSAALDRTVEVPALRVAG